MRTHFYLQHPAPTSSGGHVINNVRGPNTFCDSYFLNSVGDAHRVREKGAMSVYVMLRSLVNINRTCHFMIYIYLKYLGVKINNKNNMHQEIVERISSGNKCNHNNN